MTEYQTAFRDAIDAYLGRPGTSRSRLGQKALKDPSFVGRLEDKRNPELRTVDKVLEEMGEAPIGAAFREEVRAFLEITGVKRSEFGSNVTGNRSFAAWLLRGGSPRLATADKARRFMAKHSTPAQREEIRAAVEDSLARAGSGDVPAAPVEPTTRRKGRCMTARST